jgi:hypothetical protein
MTTKRAGVAFKVRGLAALAASICMGWCASAQANAVTDWNAVTLTYVSGGPGSPPAPAPGRAGPPGLLDIALVQLAVHDAVQVIEGEFEPYLYRDPSKLGVGSTDAAAAAASHRMLVLLYPSQQGALDAFYNTYLTSHGLLGNEGLAIGEAAAAALFDEYRPTVAVTPFFGSNAAGDWRSSTAMTFQFLAFTKPFTFDRASQFRPGPPPPMVSEQYVREYKEVKEIGDAASYPNANTEVARFWSANPIAQWSGALRQLAANDQVGDSARLFALTYLAAADSAIGAFESKHHYNFWRPITAIREGNNDRNPRTPGDAGWSPFITTPNYPDYVSGANALSGSFTGILALYYGDGARSFSIQSPLAPERFYTSFSQAADEVVEVRIQQGIHFRSAEDEGRRLGERVAHWVFMKYLREGLGKPAAWTVQGEEPSSADDESAAPSQGPGSNIPQGRPVQWTVAE